MPRPLPTELRELQLRVEDVAANQYGLDMFECFYEMLDFDEVPCP